VVRGAITDPAREVRLIWKNSWSKGQKGEYISTIKKINHKPSYDNTKPE